jgi:L-asparaginase II
MTKVNQPLDHIVPDLDDDDDMPTEHIFSGTGTRGRFAKTLREKGYTVTIHNEDGTTTTRYVSPQEVLEQNRQREKLKQQTNH